MNATRPVTKVFRVTVTSTDDGIIPEDSDVELWLARDVKTHGYIGSAKRIK